MKRLPVLFIVVIVILIVGLASGGVYIYHSHHKKLTSNNTSTKSVVTKTTKQSTKSTPPAISYYVGDIQTYSSITIKLDGTFVGAPSMGTQPANTENFGVNVTVTNNSTQTFESPDAFTSESSVYTQIGTNTLTGKYVDAENSKTDPNACFGGGMVVIAPKQTVSGCILFLIPTNVSADTYFYNDLKWYL